MSRYLNSLNPLDYVALAFEQQKLAAAAFETIWWRSSSFANGKMCPIESVAMWVEKPTALANGFEKASMAAVKGKTPAQVMQAAFAPMTAKASSPRCSGRYRRRDEWRPSQSARPRLAPEATFA